ncbi:MAG: NRAMP family divalent metal transporter [Steroidobacteraceae bacterium]
MNSTLHPVHDPNLDQGARAGFGQRLRDRLHIAELRARPRTPINRALLVLALIGPGLLVMLGDNDAGGVLTYAQTGAAYGLGVFLPLMLLMGFIAYIVQEMTIRLGAVTRRGHAELIWRRYGPFWGLFSLADLVLANILTLVTEFIGIRVGGLAFGIPYAISVPLTLAFVVATLVFLRYWAWERVALVIAAFNLVFVPLVWMAKPDWHAVAHAFVGGGWNVPGGVLSATFLILLSANIGTTIAPWQLFFQQSCVVDKGLLPKDIPASRRDLLLGVAGMVLVAMAIIIIGAVALSHLPDASDMTAGAVLRALHDSLGDTMMKLFALGLIEAGLIASVVITASSAWAIGEALDLPRSINAKPAHAWRFYAPAVMGTVLAAGIVLFPKLPLGFLNLSVQVIATVFMPAAMLFLLMLLNDRELMGDYVNGPVRNTVSVAIMVGLIVCNVLYGLATVFPHLLGA